MTQAEMERRKSTHRQSDNMRLRLAEMIEHSEDVIGGASLRIGGDVLWHVGRRETPCVEGDGTIAFSEMAHLRLLAEQIAGQFIKQGERTARARFLQRQ